jgi:ComF family protein
VIRAKEIIKDFFNLFIPLKCLNCGINLHSYELYVCKNCLYRIPKTNFYTDTQNPISQIFWGRIKLEHAFSHYYFTKASILQKLIHQIKYQGAKELAFEFGREIAYDLKKIPFYKSIDLVIPVPLHPEKERKRTYNQSHWLALGFAKELNINYSNKVLSRMVYTSTQTKKTKEERWENVKDAFEVNDVQSIENKHIVIVDDVLTTGATLEACATKLLKVKGVKASIVTLAFASD